MKPAPFQLTKEAEQMLTQMLASVPNDTEPALGWSPFVESWSKGGEYRGRYDGPMVVFGHWKKYSWPRDSLFEVCGHAVSIMPDTLEHISGRTLSCEKVELSGGAAPNYEFVLKIG